MRHPPDSHFRSLVLPSFHLVNWSGSHLILHVIYRLQRLQLAGLNAAACFSIISHGEVIAHFLLSLADLLLKILHEILLSSLHLLYCVLLLDQLCLLPAEFVLLFELLHIIANLGIMHLLEQCRLSLLLVMLTGIATIVKIPWFLQSFLF